MIFNNHDMVIITITIIIIIIINKKDKITKGNNNVIYNLL